MEHRKQKYNSNITSSGLNTLQPVPRQILTLTDSNGDVIYVELDNGTTVNYLTLCVIVFVHVLLCLAGRVGRPMGLPARPGPLTRRRETRGLVSGGKTRAVRRVITIDSHDQREKISYFI